MAIPPRFLDELRSRLTLSEIIGRRVKVIRAGREFKACCPFHKEKTPSFTINDDKQFYHCFGCGAHGSAIDFVMQHDNVSFIEAVEMLASQANMQVPQQSPEDVKKAKQQKTLYEVVEKATQFFEAQLYAPENKDALQYMKERGVSDDLISAFRIGYAPAHETTLYQFLIKEGCETQQMIDAGLVRPSQRGTEPYSFFRERIMFPVTDRRGRVVAFGGRILPDHLRPHVNSSNKPPKYINSSDTPLFHKGRMLYGASHARQAASDDQPLIVAEGYLDVMTCFSAGYRGAVAPLGTALTEDQILELWRMDPRDVKTPILCFDGDNAGQRAAARACERLLPMLKPNHSALFAFLPEGQDPDSLIRAHGAKAFKAVLDSAIPLVDFLWSYHTAGRRFNTPELRAGLSKTLQDEADRITDRQVQQYYHQELRNRVFNTFSNFKKSGKQDIAAPTIGILRRPQKNKKSLFYQILMATLVNHPHLFDHLEDDLGQVHIDDERYDLLRQTIITALGDNKDIDFEALKTYLNDQGFAEELQFVLSEAVYTHARFTRPSTPPDIVLEGWKEVRDRINSLSVLAELQVAGRALADDFSPENEERLLALQNAQKNH